MSSGHTPTPWTPRHLDNLSEVDRAYAIRAINHYELLLQTVHELKDNIEVEWTDRMGQAFAHAEACLKDTP